MPEPQQKRQDTGSGAGLAAAIAAAVLVAAPLAQKWEGYSGKVYKDPVGIPTWCYGETEQKLSDDPTYIYSKAECATLLRARMKKDYAPRVAECLPQVVSNRYVFGALIDASYNAGWAAVCKSFKPLVLKGGMQAVCNGFEGWYVSAKNRKTGVRRIYPGLVSRRKDEAAVCRQGLPLPASANQPYKRGPGDGWPPVRYRKDNATQVSFLHQMSIEVVCGKAKKPKVMMACTNVESGAIALPNPCEYPDRDDFARIACHELGHLNGWAGEHGP